MSDQFNITLFVRTWFVTFCFIVVPVFVFTGVSILLLYGFLASLIVAIITFIVVSLVGNSFGNVLFGVGDKTVSGRSSAGDLDKAKHFLRQKDMVQVKQVVDGILEKDPNCSEALLIKVQALIELGNTNQAKITLRKILKVSKNNDSTRKWASTILDELPQ